MAETFGVAEISYGVRMRAQPKIREVTFDEMGYVLRMSRGPNSNLKVYDVPFDVCSISAANSIEGFFEAHGGVRWFWWRPPRTPALAPMRKFICKEWTREPISPRFDRMTAVFQEVADIV